MWDEGTKIAIWGTGVRAKKFYLQFRDYFQVICFIDTYNEISPIRDIPVYKPENYKQKEKIVIAIEDNYSVCLQCQNLGWEISKNYLPYDMVNTSEIDYIKLWKLLQGKDVENVLSTIISNKKILLLVGNCQIENVGKLLMSSRQISGEYIWVKIPPIHLLTGEEEIILNKSEFLFDACELCITQTISREHFSKFLTTENIKRLIPEEKLIIIPVLFCDLYFPQTVHRREMDDMQKAFGLLSFPYGDCIIDELVKKYPPRAVNEIVQLDNLFSKEFLAWHFESRWKDMQERERNCTIKIYDYIADNFRKKPLFYSKNHPMKCVFLELVRRILDYLDCNDFAGEFVRIEELDAWQEYIYPSVVKGYDISWDKPLYRDLIFDKECTREEYIDGYICSEIDKAWVTDMI